MTRFALALSLFAAACADPAVDLGDLDQEVGLPGYQLAVAMDIFRGRYCGVCHDRVAFVTFFSCDRCHAVPRSAAPADRQVP